MSNISNEKKAVRNINDKELSKRCLNDAECTKITVNRGYSGGDWVTLDKVGQAV